MAQAGAPPYSGIEVHYSLSVSTCTAVPLVGPVQLIATPVQLGQVPMLAASKKQCSGLHLA